MQLIILGILSVPTSFILTKFLIGYLTKLNIIDRPDKIRKFHTKPTPTGAGLVFVIILTLGLLIVYNLFAPDSHISHKILLYIFLAMFLLISFISFLDDIREIPIIIRLIVHLICVATVLFYFFFFNVKISTNADLLKFLLLFLFSLVIYVAFINIYNFLDGMDGLTLMQSIHLSLIALILHTIVELSYGKTLADIMIYDYMLVGPILIIVLGSSIGILYFNLPPAKIFLGDVGSISLGFALGYCFYIIFCKAYWTFIPSIIANLYYITDGMGTIIIRLCNKEKIWQPHRKHFFQKAIAKGKDVKTILCAIVLCNAALMALAVFALYYPVLSMILAVLTVGITLLLL